MNEKCPVCQQDIDFEEDSPCGASDCPLGVCREEGDPRPLDFSKGHEDDWLHGTGDE
jgi:hypothetical protein